MFIERLHAENFAGLAPTPLELGRFTRLRGAPTAMASLHDALLVAFAGVDASAMPALLGRWSLHGEWGWTPPQDGVYTTTARWLPELTARPGDRILRATVDVTVDPPLFGKLRDIAGRDPRLITALAAGTALTLPAGVQVDAGSAWVHAQSIRVGGESFLLEGPDRPGWVPGLVRLLGGRIQSGTLTSRDWLEAAASWTSEVQHRVDRARAALATTPTALPELRILPDGIGVLTDAGLWPVGRLGPAAERAVGLAGAVYLRGADILVLDWEPWMAPWTEWLRAAVESDASPLEQVIVLGDPDGLALD